MAVPVPRVGAILLLARDSQDPFTEQSLSVVASLAEEAVPLLERAVELRTLARMLAKHLDVERAPGT
jgi:hypothetical protein